MSPHQHAHWCELRDRVEEHASCTARLGTVVINGDVRVEVTLTQHDGVPPLITATVIEHAKRIFLPLNIERSAELVAVLRHGMFLISRTADHA